VYHLAGSCRPTVDVNAHEVKTREIDYEAARPMFAWQPLKVKKTFEATTQYARLSLSTHLKKSFKSPFPAFIVPRRNEPVLPTPSTQIHWLSTLASPVLNFLSAPKVLSPIFTVGQR